MSKYKPIKLVGPEILCYFRMSGFSESNWVFSIVPVGSLNISVVFHTWIEIEVSDQLDMVVELPV